MKDLASGGITVMTGALSYAAPAPTLNLVAAPTGTVFIGDTATFAVRVIGADGVTPLANQSITFTASGGGAIFGACASATCSIPTDATGTASMTISPQTPGNVTLTATGIAGIQTAVFTATTRIRSITALNPTQYVAADATFVWTPQVLLADNSGSTVGVSVSWSGTGPLSITPVVFMTDAHSIAQVQATTGPLTAGAQATVAACAWTAVCSSFTAIGVDASQWQLTVVSGAGQSIPASGTFAPVVLRVTDAASHPVAGAVVEVHQTLDAWQPPCSDHGRCPVSAVYGTSITAPISDANGLVTITPLQLTGVPAITNLAAATGLHGFLSLTMLEHP